jgi:hypothetical protein
MMGVSIYIKPRTMRGAAILAAHTPKIIRAVPKLDKDISVWWIKPKRNWLSNSLTYKEKITPQDFGGFLSVGWDADTINGHKIGTLKYYLAVQEKAREAMRKIAPKLGGSIADFMVWQDASRQGYR